MEARFKIFVTIRNSYTVLNMADPIWCDGTFKSTLMSRELANIYPLLDVEDMVKYKKPDWKCVFTYVQSFYRRLGKFREIMNARSQFSKSSLNI
jgi:hypothetical protein